MTALRLRTLRIALIALLACTHYACSDDETVRKPLPDWSDGYEQDAPGTDGGGVSVGDGGVDRPDAPEDAFAVLVGADVPYPARLVRAGTNEACAVRRGAPDEPIDCILDLNELDVLALGFAVDVVAPEGMCDFVEYSGFLFENWEVGEGPTEVSYTKHEDGTFSDEVNSQNGEPRCEFDYSWQVPGGPNCCFGDVTITIESAASGEETHVDGFWAGDLSRCYEGGAFYYEHVEIGAGGFPLDELFYVGGGPVSRRYKFEGISELHTTNLPLANYWNPTDHGGDMPATHRGQLSEPYYVFICEDDAEEWRAVIRLLVREWNEEAEHDAEGNPDTTGVEPGWGTPINDRADFADLAPGASTYPQLPPVR